MAKRKQVNIRKILQLYGDKAAEAARKALHENAENLAQTAREIVPVEKGFYRGRQQAETSRQTSRQHSRRRRRQG